MHTFLVQVHILDPEGNVSSSEKKIAYFLKENVFMLE